MRIILNSSLVARFCSQKLGRSALEAVWADAIFNEIRTVTSIEPTLVDHLCTFRLPKQKLKLLKELAEKPEDIEEVRKNLIKMFNPFEGVALPQPIVQIQARFYKGTRDKLMVFYPNMFTTPTIFKALYHKIDTNQNSIVIGKQGISKSIGFLLGWHLSSLSARFRFQNPDMTKKLIQKQLLNKVYMKLLYMSWSLSERVHNMRDIINMLKCQCPEIQSVFDDFEKSRSQKIDQFIFRQLLISISQAYGQRGITCLIIMDQINALAKQLHLENQTRKIINKKEIKYPADINYLATEPISFTIYKTINSVFPQIYNNSPINIGPHMLDDPRYGKHIYFTLNLNDNEKILSFNCSYDRNLESDHNKKELCRFIWYQCAKYIKVSPQERSSKNWKVIQKRIKEKCDQFAKDGLTSSMTPLTIRQTVQARKTELEKVQKSSEEITKLIEKIYQEIQEPSLELVRQQTKKFIQGQTDPTIRSYKLSIALGCAVYIENCVKSPCNSSDGMLSWKQIPIKQLSSIIGKQKILKHYDKDLFDLNSTKDKLICKVSKKELMQLSTKWLVKYIQFSNQKLIMSHSNIFGGVFEGLLLKMIEQNKGSIFVKFSDQLFFCTHLAYFQHFWGGQKTLRSKLQNVFAEFNDQNQDVTCFALPRTAKNLRQNKNENSPNSPSFDLLIMKFDKSNQKYSITTFDLTINESKTAIKNKAKAATSLIQSLIKEQSKHYQDIKQPNLRPIAFWKHFITCRQKVADSLDSKKNEKTISKTRVLIRCQDISKIDVAFKKKTPESIIDQQNFQHLLKNIHKVKN